MSGSCGKIVLFIIAAVAALNILLAAFGWNTIISKNSTTNDPTEKLHFALENLRHELRMVHNRQNQTPNVPQLVTEVSLAPKSVHLKVSNEKSDAEMNSSNPSKSVVIFTMDSISSYENNSLSGGAAGEILLIFLCKQINL